MPFFRGFSNLNKAHYNNIHSVAWGPDGKRFASTSYEKVKLWTLDLGTRKGPGQFKHDNGYVECVACSPDGKRIASGGRDKIIKIWESP